MESKTSARRLKGLERRIKALELRQQGLTYREIAKRLGCSDTRAHVMVDMEFERLRKERAEKAEMVLGMELQRLDRLLAGHWEQAEGGDVQALNAVLRIMERRAKMLGLDAPTKIEGSLGFSTMSDEELDQEAKRVGLIPQTNLLPVHVQDAEYEVTKNETKTDSR